MVADLAQLRLRDIDASTGAVDNRHGGHHAAPDDLRLPVDQIVIRDDARPLAANVSLKPPVAQGFKNPRIRGYRVQHYASV